MLEFGAAVATNKTLVAGLLAGHVVNGVHKAASLKNGTQLTTLAGYNLTVSINGSSVVIISPGGTHAHVLVADVVGGDSVAHVIDAVLLPATSVSGHRRLRSSKLRKQHHKHKSSLRHA